MIIRPETLMSMTILRSRGIRSIRLLMRVRSVQESIVDFDRSDVFSGDKRQLSNAHDRGAGDGEPSSGGATCAIDDSNKRGRNGPCQAAAGHGEAVDLSKNLGRRCGVLEQNQGRGVYYDADEALHDQGDVDEGRGHVCGAGGDEGQHQVGDGEEDDHPDEGLPDADFFNEDREDDGLHDKSNSAIDGEVDADVVDGHAETALQVEVLEGCLGFVQDPGGEQAKVGHGVEGYDDQGDCQHDDSIVECLASVFRSRSTSCGATRSIRSALCEVAADLGSLFGSESDGVNGGEGGFADVEVLSDRSRETLLDERGPRRTACLRPASNGSGNACSGGKEGGGFVEDAGVVVDGIVRLQLLGVGFLQEKYSLNDGQDDNNDGDQIREQVRVLGPEAVRGEKTRIEASRLGQESTHCRSEDAA